MVSSNQYTILENEKPAKDPGRDNFTYFRIQGHDTYSKTQSLVFVLSAIFERKVLNLIIGVIRSNQIKYSFRHRIHKASTYLQ